jgi:hypothetical protein
VVSVTLICSCQQHYDLKQVDFVGASAGALAATLAATGVNANESLDLALKLSEENGVFERGGLKGVWGGLVRQWLDELLPDDAHDVCRDRVHLLSLQLTLPRPRRRLISDFESKEDLIGACMSSGTRCCTVRHVDTYQLQFWFLACILCQTRCYSTANVKQLTGTWQLRDCTTSHLHCSAHPLLHEHKVDCTLQREPLDRWLL